jgi:modulator of FtsH protease HflC
MRRMPIASLITAAILILILVVYSVTYQVRFSESVVKVRFGKPTAVVEEPGLKFKWPYPVEDIRKYDKRLRTLDTPETEIKTADAQNIIVGCFAFWRVADPLKFSTRVPDEREAEDKLRDRVNQTRDKVIGQHNWSDFINLDSSVVEQYHQTIEKEFLTDCAAEIRDQYGVELVRMGIWRISLPEEATGSVQESMKKERERLASQYREEGKSLKEAIVARADSQSKQILAFADRKAQEIETAGVRAAQRIFEQIEQGDADFFIWLRWLEALETALKQKTTIFLDSNGEIYKYFAQPPTENLLQGKVSAPEPKPTEESR